MKKVSKLLIGVFLLANVFNVNAQSREMTVNELAGSANAITTAVPFLTIAPESRSGGMGEVGVATEPDVWSIHWNGAKNAFSKNDISAGVAYTPWLTNIGIKDIDLVKVAASKKIDSKSTLSGSILYFSMGEIIFTDITGTATGQVHEPKEYAIDVSYALLLSDNLGMSVTGRFINSNLTGGAVANGVKSHPGRSGAADVSWFYKNKVTVNESPLDLTLGLMISNIGAKIGYTDLDNKDFIPTNMRLGGGLKGKIDEYNELGVYLDFNKYLIPTPEHEYEDPITGEIRIQGAGSDVSVPVGMFQSFTDAPGKFKEEIHEIMVNVGTEYWYNKQFAVRAGYSHEHETKGGRKYFTLGLGLRMNVFGLDFSYLLPTIGHNSPLANTLRFTLNFDIEGLKSETAEIKN